MEIVGKKGISGIVKYFLDLFVLGGVPVILALPVTLRWCFNNRTWSIGENYWFLLVFLCVTGTLGLIMVYELRKIFNNINNNEPFEKQNAKSLKTIAVMGLLISAAYIIKIFFYISFLTIVIAAVFLLFGLTGLVFSELFRQAVEVKEENDLTI